MQTVLLIVSVMLIVIVLLQSGKATDAGNTLLGGSEALFQNMKERGIELLISRVTLGLGILFFVLSLIMYLK